MTFIVDETLVGLWYVHHEPKADFMAGANKISDNKYCLQYRFRYYKEFTGDAFSDNDEKRWFKGILSADETRVVFSLREMTQQLAMIANANKVYELLMKGKTVKQFMDELEKMPFSHKRVYDKHGKEVKEP